MPASLQLHMSLHNPSPRNKRKWFKVKRKTQFYKKGRWLNYQSMLPGKTQKPTTEQCLLLSSLVKYLPSPLSASSISSFNLLSCWELNRK
jgi:hypothetical protein